MEEESDEYSMTFDEDAPIPLVRDAKYLQYENQRSQVTIEHFPDPANPEERIKFPVKVYEQSENEDAEAFLNTLDAFKTVMEKKGQWKEQSLKKNVSGLYERFATVLGGTARDDWMSVLGNDHVVESETWEQWKKDVSGYIVKDVLPYDAYYRQRDYIKTCKMPRGVSFLTYWRRVQTLNRYLPYMLTVEMMEELSDGRVKGVSKLWTYGAFNTQGLKEVILHNVPQPWVDAYERSGKTRHGPIDEMIEFFSREYERFLREQDERLLERTRGGERYRAVTRGRAQDGDETAFRPQQRPMFDGQKDGGRILKEYPRGAIGKKAFGLGGVQVAPKVGEQQAGRREWTPNMEAYDNYYDAYGQNYGGWYDGKPQEQQE